MKKFFAIAICFAFVGNAFADDWRMRKFDINEDGKIEKPELIAAGCSPKATGGLFDHADKNGDDLLNVREARAATHYIFRRHCRAAVDKPVNVRG
jgi:hypothetical protein|tara:strand:+ start:295 stop:579 length:285 start_codon:yes stop_codon:yes gene_type:complete